jgi:hypothetical protein
MLPADILVVFVFIAEYNIRLNFLKINGIVAGGSCHIYFKRTLGIIVLNKFLSVS